LSAPRRIGVFGGTFDPLHNAHLSLARAALRQAGLDEVLFVVSAAPPHKRGEVSLDAESRYAMVEAALRNEPGMQASRIEIERGGPSYTAVTLERLQAEHPGARLYLILGMDAVRDLPQWHRPERILELATVLAARRPKADAELPPILSGHCEILDFEEQPLSSTEIRARLASGRDVQDAIPAAVLALISKNRWYAGDAPQHET
jgi:nicotinate-nucleotide adenylyltransferase